MLKEIPVDAFNTSSFLTPPTGEENASSHLRLIPGEIGLYGPIGEGYSLTQPIMLDVEITRQGQFIVSNSTLETYGVGETPQEALEEFSSMLLDFYHELVDSEENLSVHYRRILQRLRSYLTTD